MLSKHIDTHNKIAQTVSYLRIKRTDHRGEGINQRRFVLLELW